MTLQRESAQLLEELTFSLPDKDSHACLPRRPADVHLMQTCFWLLLCNWLSLGTVPHGLVTPICLCRDISKMADPNVYFLSF